MTLLITIKTSPKSVGKGRNKTSLNGVSDVSVETVPEGQFHIQIAPLVWALIVMFLSEAAKSAGKSFGNQLGLWLAEKLGLSQKGITKEDLKKLFDALAQQIAAEMRAQFYQDRFQTAHEKLATAALLFNELMNAKKVSDAELSECNARVVDAFDSLEGLGYPALPGLSRAGAMMMTIGFYWFDRTKDAGRKENALVRIDRVLKSLEALVDDAKTGYSARVVGPSEVTIFNPVPSNGGKGHGGVSATTLGTQLQPMSNAPCKAYDVYIDGARSVEYWYEPIWAVPRHGWSGDIKDHKAEAAARITQIANGAREKFAKEFDENFYAILLAAKSEGAKLKLGLSGRK